MAARVAPFLNESEQNMLETESPSGTKFDISTSNMAKTVYPIINNNASVKVRLSTLESTVEVQSNYNRLNLESFGNLADNLLLTDNNLQELLRKTQEHFTNVIASIKKEYDHKFVEYYVLLLNSLILYSVGLNYSLRRIKDFKIT